MKYANHQLKFILSRGRWSTRCRKLKDIWNQLDRTKIKIRKWIYYDREWNKETKYMQNSCIGHIKQHKHKGKWLLNINVLYLSHETIQNIQYNITWNQRLSGSQNPLSPSNYKSLQKAEYITAKILNMQTQWIDQIINSRFPSSIQSWLADVTKRRPWCGHKHKRVLSYLEHQANTGLATTPESWLKKVSYTRSKYN
jgi:hypothetical protein